MRRTNLVLAAAITDQDYLIQEHPYTLNAGVRPGKIYFNNPLILVNSFCSNFVYPETFKVPAKLDPKLAPPASQTSPKANAVRRAFDTVPARRGREKLMGQWQEELETATSFFGNKNRS